MVSGSESSCVHVAAYHPSTSARQAQLEHTVAVTLANATAAVAAAAPLVGAEGGAAAAPAEQPHAKAADSTALAETPHQ